MELTEQQEAEFLELYNLEKEIEVYIKNIYITKLKNFDIETKYLARKLNHFWFMHSKIFDVIVLIALRETETEGSIISDWLKYVLTTPFSNAINIASNIFRLRNGNILYNNEHNKVQIYSIEEIKKKLKDFNIDITKNLKITNKNINKYLSFYSIEYDMLRSKKDYPEYLKYMSYLKDIDFLFDIDVLRKIKY